MRRKQMTIPGYPSSQAKSFKQGITAMLWADLNHRQQEYLQAIYDQDQENERYEKSQWTRGGRPR
jgi:hypothetical protein